ncbi:MAG: LTA synthase family protein [Bacteroidia bacterium]|nr:LTA synthase family protein [Bacteroidia bacterium]MDW8236630.1 LTA synthase family protein [Bacteroidia bacterium]
MWRIGWAYQLYLFTFFQVTRLAFLLWNKAYLESAPPWTELWLKGWLFDTIALSWLLLPMWVALLLGQRKVAFWLWLVSGLMALAVEVIDIGYFRYTLKRSGLSLLHMLSFWRDSLPALSKYVRDFTAGFFFWGLLAGGVWVGGRKLSRLRPVQGPARWVGWGLSGIILGLGLRGGWRLKPLSAIDAAIEGCPSCTPFVLNTTFMLLKSIEQPPLPPWPEAPPSISPYPRWYVPPASPSPAPQYNVVIFILESFSQEYIEQGYAPFLRQLLSQGHAVRWGFATNTRSAEGIPAILSGMPSWSEEPLIFTPYITSIRYSLGELLSQWGYTTLFFHGGNNGTMLLDSYTRQAGFQYYIGRKEYPRPEADYDGTWGIWDEPFLRFCADKIDSLPQPFLAVVFTLSSHHPYAIPPSLRDSFLPGTLPIHRCIQYTDRALRSFFERAEKAPWFRRTLFVFTADHTGPSEAPYHPVRTFWVPIGFYLPTGKLPAGDSIGSHIDILPSILETIGYPYRVPVWGRSLWHYDSLAWTAQKPMPFVFQAVGRKEVVSLPAGGKAQVLRWEGTPWHTQSDTALPNWWGEWLAYLAGYGKWLTAGGIK